jgi:cell division protein FtsZ
MALDGLKFVIEEDATPRTKIRVFGVGGGGSNAVARMMNEGVKGVEFCVLNTDAQALAACPVPTKLTIGAKITHGLGAGSDPAVGRHAALEDTERIIDLLEGADMVFVTAGLGGGTGTGAAPVVASLAKELGALTVAVVTKPFSFEGPRRSRMADQGLAELAGVVDTVITVPNDQLLSLVPKGTSFFEAFRAADDVLRQAVQGISDIINTPGLINRDFSDVRSIMAGMGYAMLGTASAKGENACVEAARRAISSPMMEAGGVRGARGVLINIAGSSALGLHEVNEACTLVREATANDDVQHGRRGEDHSDCDGFCAREPAAHRAPWRSGGGRCRRGRPAGPGAAGSRPAIARAADRKRARAGLRVRAQAIRGTRDAGGRRARRRLFRRRPRAGGNGCARQRCAADSRTDGRSRSARDPARAAKDGSVAAARPAANAA